MWPEVDCGGFLLVLCHQMKPFHSEPVHWWIFVNSFIARVKQGLPKQQDTLMCMLDLHSLYPTRITCYIFNIEPPWTQCPKEEISKNNLGVISSFFLHSLVQPILRQLYINRPDACVTQPLLIMENRSSFGRRISHHRRLLWLWLMWVFSLAQAWGCNENDMSVLCIYVEIGQ